MRRYLWRPDPKKSLWMDPGEIVADQLLEKTENIQFFEDVNEKVRSTDLGWIVYEIAANTTAWKECKD